MKKIWIIAVLFTISITLVGCKKEDKDPIDNNVTYEAVVQDERIVTSTELVVYEGPSVLESSEKVSIFVEDQELFVYETLVNHGRVFSFSEPTTKNAVAIFDFEGSVEVTMTFPDTVTSAVVRPLAYTVEPTIDGNTITFTLEYPTNYVIEINEDTDNAVHLFANPLEEDTPDPNNIPDDMVYIGPGVYKADAIPVQSDTTVYIAGGAVVYGQIHTEDVKNLTIRGRGIISGDIYERNTAAEATIPIVLRHCENITIEGIAFLNSAGWTINSYFVDGLHIDNIKVITARANGDGISLQSNHNVLVENSFVRAWDDALVVKNYDRGTTDNIVFRNMTVWTDLAQSMEIGYETYGETMNNILFEDITVLHNFHKPIISIHNADDAAITNVVYRNITVEDAQMQGDLPLETYDDFLFEFFVKYNQVWSSSGGDRGSIDNVTIENVNVLAGKENLVSHISGYSDDFMATNFTFKNVTIYGETVKSSADMNLATNDFVNIIDVSYNIETPRGARLYLPYTLGLTDDAVTHTTVPGIIQDGYLVPDFAIGELPSLYIGNQVEGTFTAMATHGTSILEWDDGSGEFTLDTSNSYYAIDGDTSTMWQSKEFMDQTGEFTALSITFDEDKTIGTIRLYGNLISNLFVKQNIAVYGIKSSSETGVYTKVLNSDDYEFSPASGNYIDINLNPGEYSAIQIRFYKRTGTIYPTTPFISEVEFYPASLTFGKPVTGTAHQDVYEVSNVTDGSLLTYYESEKGTWPAILTIDLYQVSDFNVITLHLPPLMQWGPRDQEIEILGSNDGVTFEIFVTRATYSFDPVTGNVIEIFLDTTQTYRYVQFVYYSSTAPGGVGAQISEIKIFE